jgi:hypothetical protein
MPEEKGSSDMFMEPFKATAPSEVLMQRLLVDVDLRLESIDSCVRQLMREFSADHPRRRDIDKIKSEVSELHTIIADCIAHARTSAL